MKKWLNNSCVFYTPLYFFLSILFYLILKCSSIFLLWLGRVSPPMPSDSIFYISSIRYYIENNLIGGTTYKSYVYILGEGAKLFSFSAIQIYQYQFYFGVFFSLVAIVFLMRKLEFNYKQMSLSLILLAVVKGLPGTNFWITPNYWSVYLLIFSLGICFGRNDLNYKFIITCMLILFFGAFLHRSFVFYSISMFFFLSLFMFLHKGLKDSKRFIFSFFISIFFYGIVIFLSSSESASSNAYIPSLSRKVISIDNFQNSLTSTKNMMFYVSFFPAFILFFLSKLYKISKLVDIVFLSCFLCFLIFSFHYRTRGLLLLYPITIIYFCYHVFSVNKIVRNILIGFFIFTNSVFLVGHIIRLNAINDIVDWNVEINIPENYSSLSVSQWLAPSLMRYSRFTDFTVNVWNKNSIKNNGVIVLLNPEKSFFVEFSNSYWLRVNEFILDLDSNFLKRVFGAGYPHDSLRLPASELAKKKLIHSSENLTFSNMGDFGPISIYQYHK